MEEEIFPSSISEAIYNLTTPSFSITIKLNTLRYILSYLNQENNILNINERIKLNQLLLDTILYIIQKEDNISDLRKRQLIKTECFLMLAKLLQSKTLFSGVRILSQDDSNILDSNNKLNSSQQNNNGNIIQSQDDSIISSPDKNGQTISQITKSSNDFESSPIRKNKKLKVNLLSKSVSQLPNVLSNSENINHSDIEHNQLFSKSFNQIQIDSSPLKKKSYYKPRQSVLLGSKLRQERIVPGVDSQNVIKIDKQLGYQKSRLWVPFSGPGIYYIYIIIFYFFFLQLI